MEAVSTCTVVPPYLVFKQGNPGNLDLRARFSEGQGAKPVPRSTARMMAFMHSLLQASADTGD